MRITPLLSGDQPFVSWHSIDMFSCSSTTNTPRGHEDGELMNKSDWLTSCPRRVFNNYLKYARFQNKNLRHAYVRFLGDKELIYGTDRD